MSNPSHIIIVNETNILLYNYTDYGLVPPMTCMIVDLLQQSNGSNPRFESNRDSK